VRHTIKSETDLDIADLRAIIRILIAVNDDNDNDDQTARFMRIALLLGSLMRRAEARQRRMAPKREE
jgi:hypothetical protein